MTALAADGRIAQAMQLYRASIGKKAVMAVTGLVLFGFVVGHLLGNLQVFLGPEKINAYARFLHEAPVILWGTRVVLLVAVALHLVAAVQLTLLKKEARPARYGHYHPSHSTYASRTMIWSGPILAAFVVYHLLHFTTGTAHPNFVELSPYENMVNGFRMPWVSFAYIVAMLALGFHLQHGVWSMFQSVGINHPRYTPWLKRLSTFAALAIVAGNVSIPLAVLTGLVR